MARAHDERTRAGADARKQRAVCARARRAGGQLRTLLPLSSASERSPTDAFFISTQPARATRDCESFEVARPVYVVEKAEVMASMIIWLVGGLRRRGQGAAAVRSGARRAGKVRRVAAGLAIRSLARGSREEGSLLSIELAPRMRSKVHFGVHHALTQVKAWLCTKLI